MRTDDIARVRAGLRAACVEAGSIRAWAQARGLTEGYVRHVLTGLRPPSERLLAALGYELRLMPISRKN